jgi:hypothetical protein
VCEERVVLATEPGSGVLALGARNHVQPLLLRTDVPAAIGIIPFAPVFLVVSSGRKRTQGKIVFLENPTVLKGPKRKAVDIRWAAAVRSAAARRIPICPGSEAAKAAWSSAAAAARRRRRRR